MDEGVQTLALRRQVILMYPIVICVVPRHLDLKVYPILYPTHQPGWMLSTNGVKCWVAHCIPYCAIELASEAQEGYDQLRPLRMVPGSVISDSHGSLGRIKPDTRRDSYGQTCLSGGYLHTCCVQISKPLFYNSTTIWARSFLMTGVPSKEKRKAWFGLDSASAWQSPSTHH